MPKTQLLADLSYEEWMRATFGEDRDFYPVDLDPILAGNLEPPSPAFLRRSDDAKLLYAGKLHWVASEPEAGKTWLALIASRDLLEAGRPVVYLDYEMSPEDVVRRLLLLGASRDAISRSFVYIRPPGKMTDEVLEFYGTSTESAPALFGNAALVVFDACTEAMTADGFDPLSNVDVAAWLQRAPRLALRMGAAVLVLDHVPKDRENRGRYAIGAQHKLAQTDVQYSLRNVRPFAPGSTGLSTIVVEKDRPGGIRKWALDGRRVGTLVVNAEDLEHLEGFLAAPTEEEGPTDRMRQILEVAHSSAVPLSKNQLESVGGGRGSTNRGAVTRLIAAGRLVPAPGDEGRTYPRYVAAPEPEGTAAPAGAAEVNL